MNFEYMPELGWRAGYPMALGLMLLVCLTLYRLFNAEDDIVCERFFLPPKTELAELAAAKASLLTLESQTPVGEFDVVRRRQPKIGHATSERFKQYCGTPVVRASEREDLILHVGRHSVRRV